MVTQKKLFAAAITTILFLIGFAQNALAVPSFARQTGLACQACHTVFPELTPFGRSFKLNAYTIDNLPQVQGMTPSKDMELLLNQVPPLSFMFQTSYTQTKTALPDPSGTSNAQNGQVLFPQQASLFYAGRIGQSLGSFVQLTYASDSGTIGLDNTEFRYAKQVTGGNDRLTYGFTLNNNPTVQDVWNSTPAWQTPFDQRTSAAPTPGAAAQIDGGLGGTVAGLTGYVWWMNSVYAEYGLYRAAPQGVGGQVGAGPLDSNTGTAIGAGVLSGWPPCWRLGYEHQWDTNSLSVGAYGMTVKISPEGQPIGPPVDKYDDTALDAQYQLIGDENIFSLQTTYIKEKRSFGATATENSSGDLKTFRLGGSYYYQRTYGGSLGYFSTAGSSDAVVYPSGTAVTGFAANNSPNSNGWVGELDWIPYQNVKVLLQYVTYGKFNGASSNYDGNGRNASDNNTLYLLGWFAF